MWIKPDVTIPWRSMQPALETMLRDGIPLEDANRMFCRAYVQAALRVTDGHKTKASQMLGIHRNTLYRYVEK